MDDVNKKPAPLRVAPRPHICSVCGKNSYSLAGIHPQCAARAADQARMDRVRADRLATPSNVISTTGPASRLQAVAPARHQKVCSRCRKVQHVRRKICECGHAFAGIAAR